jgi:3-hexulose-6-phosphate synthase
VKTIVQISLDVTNIPEAIETAQVAIRAGVDWLEVGTPLIIAEGMNGVRALRKEFRDVPIVADLKTMDGGWLEAEMMAKAGATHVVVMERAHAETIKVVVKAGKDFGVKVMGDNLAASSSRRCERRSMARHWLSWVLR